MWGFKDPLQLDRLLKFPISQWFSNQLSRMTLRS
jgi:hypothetical protein